METELNAREICCVQSMIQEALKLQEDEKKEGRSIYFRGQEWEDKDSKKDKGPHLLPSIGRLDKYKFTGEQIEPNRINLMMERNLLHRFSRYAYLELKRAPGEWEAIFLARHHGLPTRLLDWTSNPLVALFNAAKYEENKGKEKSKEEKEEEKSKRAAAVWAIVRKSEDEVKSIDLLREESKITIKHDKLYYQNIEDLPIQDKLGNVSLKDLQKPLRLKGVRLLYPFYVHPRMIVQHSFFTIQDNPWSPLGEEYGGGKQEEYIEIKKIILWKVPEEKRWDIIYELERFGIDNRTLYPDLDGLAKGLWQLEIIRQHDSRTDK